MKNIKFYLNNLFLCTTILTYTNHAMENDDAMDIDAPSSSQQTPELLVGQKRKFDEQEQGDDANVPATKRPRLGNDTPSLASMQQTLEELTNERILIDRAYKGLVSRTAIKINQSNFQETAFQDHKHAWFVLMEIRDKHLDSTQFDILFKDIKEKAIEGTADYQFLLGIMYENGIGVDKNESEAFEWVQEAAVQEHAHAQNSLAEYYMRGYGTPKDLKETFDWYRQAAEQGHAQAQYNLGVCYIQGCGTPKDLKEAFKWFQKAADQGFALAQYNLGACYAQGLGIPKDLKEAFEWYRKAAAQGLALAQYNLGVFYAQGRGTPKNETRAFEWYRKAAAQGLVPAQNNLGHVYKHGMGVDKNEAEALMWYTKAAENGNQDQRTVLKTIFTYLPSQQNGFPLTLDDFNDVLTPLDDMLEFFKIWIRIVDPASGFQEKGLKDKELYDLHTKLKESTQNLLTLVKTIQTPREHFLMTSLNMRDQAPKEWKDAVFAENYKGISYLSIGTENIDLSKKIFSLLQSDNPFQDTKEYIQSINDYNTREYKPLLKDRIAELTNQITLEGNQLKEEALEALQKRLERLKLSEEDLLALQENLDSFLSLLDQLKDCIEQYVVAGAYDRNKAFLAKNLWIKN